MFKCDLLRALCIAFLVVPVWPLAHTASAAQQQIEPLQPVATTQEQLSNAMFALGAGTSAEQAVLAQADPVRQSSVFQRDFFEALFGRGYNEAEAVYDLEPEFDGVFDSDVPFEISGVTIFGDVFTVSIDLIQEADLGSPGAIEQGDLGAAGVGRVWGLECTVSTTLATIRVVGGLAFGLHEGAPVWRLFPTINLDSEFYLNAVNSNLPQEASTGTPHLPDDPTGVDLVCTDNSNTDYDLCLDLANIEYAGCVANATVIYLAALAACVGTVFIPVVGFWGSLACIVTITAAYVGGLVRCGINRAVAKAGCQAIHNSCLVGCGWIIA